MYCAKYQPLIAAAHFSGVWLDCLRAVLTQAGNLLAQIGTRARLPKCTEPLGVVNPLACQEALEDLSAPAAIEGVGDVCILAADGAGVSPIGVGRCRQR